MANPTQATLVRGLLFWSISFLAIPVAGYFGTFLVGRVDNLGSALLGGGIVGLLVGIAQSLASRGRLFVRRWSAATAIGLSLGVAAGTFAVGYHTALADLATAGAITGVILGAAQAIALPTSARPRWTWIPLTAVLWPMAWTITALAGIKVDEQFIVFGASGASVYTILVGGALYVLTRTPHTAAAAASAAVAVSR